jgi:N-acyl-D-aspartate/D-glutamate deacylase
VKCGRETVVHDFPGGAWRIKESAEGIFGTVVNGQVLYEEGKYTGALPGKVLRNAHYEQNRRSNA